jgi:hypothetical protein
MFAISFITRHLLESQFRLILLTNFSVLRMRAQLLVSTACFTSRACPNWRRNGWNLERCFTSKLRAERFTSYCDIWRPLGQMTRVFCFISTMFLVFRSHVADNLATHRANRMLMTRYTSAYPETDSSSLKFKTTREWITTSRSVPACIRLRFENLLTGSTFSGFHGKRMVPKCIWCLNLSASKSQLHLMHYSVATR